MAQVVEICPYESLESGCLLGAGAFGCMAAASWLVPNPALQPTAAAMLVWRS
jgi:hypothetical protein